MIVLQTERLILRHFKAEDAAFILELLNEPSFIQNIGDRGIRSLEDALQYLAKGPIKSYEVNGFGLFCVDLKTTGEAIGMSGLIKRPGLEDVDIGFAFLPKFWSQGYAVESAHALLKFAREKVGLKKVVGITSPANESSIRVLEKIGLKFERLHLLPNEASPVKLFAIDLSES